MHSQGPCTAESGIGERLRRQRKRQGFTLKDISERSIIFRDSGTIDSSFPTSISFFSKVEHGKKHVRIISSDGGEKRVRNLSLDDHNVLLDLSTIYSMDPVILNTFCATPQHGFAILRGPSRDDCKKWRDPGGEGAYYLLSKCHLAESDLAISFLNLPPGASTRKEHSHEGDELAIVEKGNVTLHLGQSQHVLSEEDVCHFRSQNKHRYENLSPNNEARVIVVRLFEREQED